MFFRLRPAGLQPTTTDPDILGKNPKNPEIVSTAKPQNELAKNPQTIQEQLLRPTKISPAKAVISFTQSDNRRREQILDRPRRPAGPISFKTREMTLARLFARICPQPL
jgi:hypothetical protein